MMLKKGEHFWIDSSIGVPIGGCVKISDSGQYCLIDDEGKERFIPEGERASLKPMHPTSVEGVDDMIRLGDLSEAGLLRNLLVRHRNGIIYTYIGSVLVAMNPYEMLPIYTADQVHMYHGRKLGELSPHIFAIADSCYFNMCRNKRNQCCIISGESGAGKTESTKLILQFLAAVSGQHSWIEQQIIQANPVLEAFGNAKTIRNDNSSRFGKYVEIFFNKKGVIEGAHMEQYLLEKSRVCHQAPQERNYHIFYCMLSGMPSEQKKILSLGNASQFKYLTEGDCLTCDGRDDADEFGRIRAALKVLTFTDKDCWEIFKLLAAILHMGNINFQSTIMNNMDSCDVLPSNHFSVTAKLLEVEDAVLEKSLTHRSFMTNREIVTKALSSTQATNTRDAFAKAMYGRLFVWMFTKINSAIHKPQTDESSYTRKYIGLLDIFGFENFPQNSFEQLCINYANEHLQQFFVSHVFKLEQDEYSKEGILWKRIAFSDNQKTLDLLAIKPLNILALIDEESNFPKGTDATMLNKMNQEHNGNKQYISSKSQHGMQFGVQHFAGLVYYDCEGFLEKNRDALSMDIMDLVRKSSNKLLKYIFEKDMNTNSVKNANKTNKIIMTPKNSLRQVNDSRRQISTLSGQFRQSLDYLMKALSLCQPFFIRCFKPNDKKRPMAFDRELCMQQLRYSGMLETIRIRKSGYPIRHTFKDFLQRYRVLLKSADCDPNTEPPASCCAAICRAMIKDEEDWKIGKTKIFLRDHHDSFLEMEREQELYRKALIIQRVMLAHKDREAFVKKRRAALVLQKNWRGLRDRKDFCKLKLGFARLQAKVRSRQLHTEYKRRQAAAITLQTQTRGYLARKDLKCKKKAVILLQTQTRGLLARKTLKKMKSDAFLTAQEKEAQDLAALELQQRLEELLRKNEEAAKSQSKDDEEMVENLFGFMSTLGGQEGPAPEGFEDLEAEPGKLEEVELVESPVTERKVTSIVESPVSERKVTSIVESPVTERKVTSIPDSSKDDINDKKDEKEAEDDEFAFSKFASLHFQGFSTHSHIQQRLRKPLLYHEDEGDTLASLTVWWIILRFMGDLPEPKQERVSAITDPIQRNLGQRQARRLSSLVGLDQKFLRKKVKQQRGTGKRKHSAIPEEEPEDMPQLKMEAPQHKMEAVQEEEDVLFGEGPTFDRPMTPLEKLHIIVGYAIVRQDIRDEIYCQICKQLSDNKNQKSAKRGWILLSICLGIFSPTDRLNKFLESFIRHGPSEYSSYCAERLRRTSENGERSEPPCWIELQSVETKKPIVVAVGLMDGKSISLHVDSASTSAEVCNAVFQKTNLKDTYGFSLYAAMNEKMWSLGSGSQHVLDAVSMCEQEERRQGREEQQAPWRLYFRKEIFTPWHDCSSDQVSTGLIYRQIIHGLKHGDYMSDKEDDYVQLAAKHYYIQHGSESSLETSEKIVRECMNMTIIENKSLVRLVQLVNSAHTQGPYINSTTPVYEVKAEIVQYAREKWPIYFSRLFEAELVSGPPLPQDQFVVVVNWKGVFFQDGTEAAFLQLSYPEVSRIEILSEEKSDGLVCLTTPKGMYELKVVKGKAFVDLANTFISGLKKRSLYAVAIQDLSRQEDPTLLSFRRGDVLYIIKDGDYAPEGGWIEARNERTSQTGAVSLDAIQILPILTKPTEETLNLLNLTPARRKSLMPVLPQKEELLSLTERVAHVTLKEFSFDYFRESGKEGGRGKGGAREKLWAISKDPLKQPLLKNLQGNSELCHLACDSFTAILKYMGDYPVKHVRTPIDLTNQIFGPATAHVELRDEIYCQIMKQMTNNKQGLSMERGWQLLWLCCGLFPPSQLLLRHVQRFLESRPREPLASTCLQRMQAMLSIEGRKLPPHQVEVDAIQNNSTQIFHKVHFPNDTSEIFEVTTTTRIRDLIRSIAKDLRLSSSDGYSLFVKTANKVVSMESEEYFFDNLRQLTDVVKKGKKVKEATPAIVPYLVLFMRKLWFNVIPGRDLTADLMFHFPQEVPKYLRGYHSVSKEDMISLAGLLLRTQIDTDKSQFVMIPKMLKDLVPADQQRIMTPEDWKKHMISAYNKQAGITVDEAKLLFLKTISQWPTFGCAFFELKQTSEKSYPSVIMISISKQGVSIIDPKTKEVLVMHLFSKITSWSSGNTFFHMTIGNLVQGNTLLCESSLGYKISDLLSSYKNMYMKEITVVRPRNQMFS